MSKNISSTRTTKIAVKTLQNSTSSSIQKSLAGSVLSQVSPNKTTSKKMSVKASEVLNSSKYSKTTKSLAGSVLEQAKGNK
ncbi:hypothetical protein ACFX2U_07510 [Gilliamella apicola]|uniref:hypothetical protein n=1 Tax=Gilliamella apicola TaxID=1196095 RepID=UPI003987ACBD